MNGTSALSSASVDALADAAFASGPQGQIVAWNAAAERLLGISAADAIGAGCAALLEGRTHEGVPVCTSHCPLVEMLPRSAAHPDLTVRREDGGHAEVNVVAIPVVLDGAPALLHLLRERTVDQRDPLTGCLRPWSFEGTVAALQDHAKLFSEPLAAAMVGVDGMAAIRLDAGRPASDRVLAAVAAYLRYGRRDDAVCRWGDDDFALVLPAMTAGQAAERLRATLDIVREQVRPGGRPVSFSAGVVDLDAWGRLSLALHRAGELRAKARLGGDGRILTG